MLDILQKLGASVSKMKKKKDFRRNIVLRSFTLKESSQQTSLLFSSLLFYSLLFSSLDEKILSRIPMESNGGRIGS